MIAPQFMDIHILHCTQPQTDPLLIIDTQGIANFGCYTQATD